MKIRRFMTTASAASVLMMSLAGTAAAADAVTVDGSGPSSTNTVSMNSQTSITTNNSNTITVVNQNVQSAQSGNVSATGNTSVGNVGSGNATNNASQVTAITITNQPSGGLGSTPPGNNPGGGNQGGSGNTPGNNQNQPTGNSGGNVLGASTGGQGAVGGVAMLPSVGASSPIDVSALRAAWQPPVAKAPLTELARQSSGITGFMLIVAAALSLLGAIGSAVYAQRKQGKV